MITRPWLENDGKHLENNFKQHATQYDDVYHPNIL